MDPQTEMTLRGEIEDLRRKLQEADDTLEAIRSGEVDALVVRAGGANEVYTLEGAERPYRLFIEEMRQGAVTLGPDGMILFCNRRFAEMVRLNLNQIVGRHFAEFVPPEKRGDWRSLLSQADSARATGEVVLERADGLQLPAAVAINILVEASGKIYCLVIADLTEQKHYQSLIAAERSLRRSEERFRSTLLSIGDGVITADEHGAVTFMNPVAEQLTGWTRPRATGSNLQSVFSILSEATRQPVPNLLTRGFRRTEGGAPERCGALLSRNGETIPIEYNATPIFDNDASLSGAVLVFHDATAQHAAEEALKEAGRRKDEFLAILAHELRNPLAPIRTAAHILGLRGTEDPELRTLYELIGRQAGQMAKLVDDLLDVSRLERGKIELRMERVDFSSMVGHALEVCRTLIEARRHRVWVDLPRRALEVDGDPVRVEQMMCNLITNACKHTPPGGEIRIIAERRGSSAVLRVGDNGIGMTPEQMEHIFEMFYQGRQGDGDRGAGLGLGLTLVRELAKRHGGSIAATSDGLGQGSEFTLCLPALDPAKGPVRPTEPALAATPGPRGKANHILVVDDNPSVVMTVQMLLVAFGYRVSVAATGAAGVKKAVDLCPDLALVDLGLPDMSGFDVAARIRDALGSGIHLIALTGFSRESDVAAALAAGFDRHLVKSTDPRELVETVHTFFN